MNDKEDIYTNWLRSRSWIDPPEGFADRVMENITSQEQTVERLTQTIGIRPFLQKTIEILVGFGLSVFGIFRVTHLVGSFLIP